MIKKIPSKSKSESSKIKEKIDSTVMNYMNKYGYVT